MPRPPARIHAHSHTHTHTHTHTVVKERIFSMAFHPSAVSPLVVAGDKWGQIGFLDLRPDAQENVSEGGSERGMARECEEEALRSMYLHVHTCLHKCTSTLSVS